MSRGIRIGAGSGPAGDLLVTINVTIPTKLTKEQRSLVEKLASALHEDADHD